MLLRRLAPALLAMVLCAACTNYRTLRALEELAAQPPYEYRTVVQPVYTDTLPDLVAELQALYGAEGARIALFTMAGPLGGDGLAKETFYPVATLVNAGGARDLRTNTPLTPIGSEVAAFLLAHLANAEAYAHVCVRFASVETTPRGQVRGQRQLFSAVPGLEEVAGEAVFE